MAVSHGHLAACFRGYASPVDPSAHYSLRLRLCPRRSSSLCDARVKDKTRPRRRAAGSESESAASATEAAAHWPFGVNSIVTWIMGPLFLTVGSLSILMHPPRALRCPLRHCIGTISGGPYHDPHAPCSSSPCLQAHTRDSASPGSESARPHAPTVAGRHESSKSCDFSNSALQGR